MKYICFIILCLFSLLKEGQGQEIGDVIRNPDGSQGVVFWIDPNGNGGWMVSFYDLPPVAWGVADFNVPGLPDHGELGVRSLQSALRDTAGYSNTKILREYYGVGSTYSAQVVDFNNGWYLPACGQLRKLFAAAPIVNSVLRANGGTELKSTGSTSHDFMYPSSTEGVKTYSWFCIFSNGQVGTVEKKPSVVSEQCTHSPPIR